MSKTFLSRPGLVLDTGALIELQKYNSPFWEVVKKAYADDQAILAPTAVLTEWYAGGNNFNATKIQAYVAFEDVSPDAAIRAGSALVAATKRSCTACGLRGGTSVVDALVMELADRGADTVYTGDLQDLGALASTFRKPKLTTW